MNVQVTRTPQAVRPLGKAELIIACMAVNKMMQQLDDLVLRREKAWFKKTRTKIDAEIASLEAPMDKALFEIVKLVRRHGQEKQPG